MSLDAALRELVAAEIEKAKAELRTEFAASASGWPEWMPIDVAAAYLGQTIPATRKLYERHKVPVYQDGPGAKVWLRRSDLDTYMESNRT